MTTSRRRFLLAGAGAGAAMVTGCAHRRAAVAAEALGAFPMLPVQTAVIGPQVGVARLNNNENPYGPAPSAIKMMDYAAKKGAYYGESATPVLARMIAERYGVTADHVTLSTGSAEALSAVAMIYGRRGPIVAPRLFFDATVMYAKRLGLATVQRAPMHDDLRVNLPALEAMVTESTGMVQICNPNNPTGLLHDAATLKAAVKRMAAKTTVIVDEAYMELTDQPETNSCIDLVQQGYNVIVSRTFSKLYGMAGVRVGYTISTPETAQEIRAATMSWMSGIGLAAAIGCLNDIAFTQRSQQRIREAREMTVATLDRFGLESLPSHTNFVYFKSGRDANALQAALAAQKIQIRGQYMDYASWSRVSMGRLEDVARFCATLPRILYA